MMLSFPHLESVPLVQRGDIVFVANTRIPLDTVVDAYLQGNSAEEIVSQFDALDLPDVHSVIAFYLRHKVEVDQYVQQRDAQAEQVRNEYRSRNQHGGLRERLLARRQAQQGVQ